MPADDCGEFYHHRRIRRGSLRVYFLMTIGSHMLYDGIINGASISETLLKRGREKGRGFQACRFISES